MLGVEVPAVEEQRRHARAVGAALDLADENDVVAFLVAAAVEAFEYRHRPGEQRGAGHAVELVCADTGRPMITVLDRADLGLGW